MLISPEAAVSTTFSYFLNCTHIMTESMSGTPETTQQPPPKRTLVHLDYFFNKSSAHTCKA